jgi:hypothetical protein
MHTQELRRILTHNCKGLSIVFYCTLLNTLSTLMLIVLNLRGRRHRPNVLRRIKPGKTPVVPGSGNQGVLKEKEYKPKRDSDDPSSMSETEQSGKTSICLDDQKLELFTS